MNLDPVTTIPIQNIACQIFEKAGISVDIKREDFNHPYISGNKLRKLKYNLLEAKAQGFKRILTFGGAYSNHIVATAAAGSEHGFETIGVIRGDELGRQPETLITQNPSLRRAHKLGMQFLFVSRAQYRRKEETSFVNQLRAMFDPVCIVPEGGTNDLALTGVREILTDMPKEAQKYDYIASAVGTGGTLSGLIQAAASHQRIIGFPVLKNAHFLFDRIQSYTNTNTFDLYYDYHFGGYAKHTRELITFINDFYAQTHIPLDPVYTGKMMYGLHDLAQKHSFARGSRLLVIHTGGLQGIQGINLQLAKKGDPTITYNPHKNN